MTLRLTRMRHSRPRTHRAVSSTPSIPARREAPASVIAKRETAGQRHGSPAARARPPRAVGWSDRFGDPEWMPAGPSNGRMPCWCWRTGQGGKSSCKRAGARRRWGATSRKRWLPRGSGGRRPGSAWDPTPRRAYGLMKLGRSGAGRRAYDGPLREGPTTSPSATPPMAHQ